MPTITNTAEIFQPLDPSNLDSRFREHYEDIFGKDITNEKIIDLVYGGKPLKPLYSEIVFSATEEQVTNLRANICLSPKSQAGVKPLKLRNVGLRQFLIAGFPWLHNGTKEGIPGPSSWDGEDRWNELHEQYRLELCHSEISRWSVFFKQSDKLAESLDPNDIEDHEQFETIELVNNCTTWWGFEFRVKFNGDIYHGSFGSKPNTNVLQEFYSALSRQQAGSYARQTEKLAGQHSPYYPSFGFATDTDIYSNFDGWGPDKKANPSNTIDIDLNRYYQGTTPLETRSDIKVYINDKKIHYDRWGDESEYLKKAKKRRLMISRIGQGEDAVKTKNPPETYAEVYESESITLPNFSTNGVYQINDPVRKQGYGWLRELKTCSISPQSNGLFTLELLRTADTSNFELRRIVFGNINLKDKVPVYNPRQPEETIWTLDRFGLGARNTSMTYDTTFIPPHGETTPSHFAYILAGSSQDPKDAIKYVCPEPFGVERAIFAWANPEKTKLVIDLMSFERILPVWQGEIDLPSELLNF